MSWARDLVTDVHGAFDVGRFALFAIMWVVLGAIPVMVAGGVIEAIANEHHIFPYSELGKGIGYVTAAFAAALGALGAYVAMDKRPTAPLPDDAPPPPAAAPAPAPPPAAPPANPYG